MENRHHDAAIERQSTPEARKTAAEREVKTPQHPSTSAVGMDWGVVNFVTLSDGEVVEQCLGKTRAVTRSDDALPGDGQSLPIIG